MCYEVPYHMVILTIPVDILILMVGMYISSYPGVSMYLLYQLVHFLPRHTSLSPLHVPHKNTTQIDNDRVVFRLQHSLLGRCYISLMETSC